MEIQNKSKFNLRKYKISSKMFKLLSTRIWISLNIFTSPAVRNMRFRVTCSITYLNRTISYPIIKRLPYTSYLNVIVVEGKVNEELACKY